MHKVKTNKPQYQEVMWFNLKKYIIHTYFYSLFYGAYENGGDYSNRIPHMDFKWSNVEYIRTFM